MTAFAASGELQYIYFLGPGPTTAIKFVLPSNGSLPDKSAISQLSREFEALEHLGVDEEKTSPLMLDLLKKLGLWESGQLPDQAEWTPYV